MRTPVLPTTIIGSLPKPAWLTSEWYTVTEKWNLSGDSLQEALDDATRLALADQDAAGIDIVCDGGQRRPTHYSYFLTQLGGVDLKEMKAKAMRGGKFTQNVPRVVGPLTLQNHRAVQDYLFLKRLTPKPIKMTLPGPSTLVDGTYDDHYGDERALALAYARVLNEEIKALELAGCEMVQIDEPSFTRLPRKVHDYGVDAIDATFAGTRVKSCVHICYGYRARIGDKEWKHGYEEIFPALVRSKADQFSLELAEPNLAPKILSMLPGKTIQAGVVEVGSLNVETPETVADRLRGVLEVVPSEHVIAAPDCGCVALSRDVARAKMQSLVLGAAIVRAQIARR